MGPLRAAGEAAFAAERREVAEEDATPVREDEMLLLNAGDNLDEEAESLAITGPPSGCTLAPVARWTIESLPEKLPLDEDDTLLVA